MPFFATRTKPLGRLAAQAQHVPVKFLTSLNGSIAIAESATEIDLRTALGFPTQIIGDFGVSQTPATLPVNGFLPADWDAPGSPAADFQCVPGQSLIYNPANVNDPLFQHLMEYVGTAIDPSGWINAGKIGGPAGPPGAPGPAATITVGTTQTGQPGTPADVVNVGDSSTAVFDFTIPEGVQGQAATIAVGTTTTGMPGTQASVSNSGSAQAAVFDFTIPRGDQGLPGAPPIGGVMDYAGATAPLGWLLCDGASYPTATYPDLFAAIGYTWGGSGADFNVPDLRSRITLGAGAGTGLTNRVLAAIGGEEVHWLSVAEMAAHTHGLSAHTHLGANHTHDLQNHQHYGVAPDHLHSDDHTHASAVSGQAIVSGGASGAIWSGGWLQTNYKSQNGWGATTGYCDRALAFWTGGPNINGTGWAQQGLTTGGPSIDSTTSSGGGTAHNNMPPFAVLNKIIKAWQ